MGKRSIRMEMRKLHEMIRQNEEFLMAQRLQAWYSIGYKLWYKQHPVLTEDSILNKYVKLDNIKTRRFFTVDSLKGYKENNEYESTYDTFCDVTILADTSDLAMKNSFTI